jgi:hypothetical protein
MMPCSLVLYMETAAQTGALASCLDLAFANVPGAQIAKGSSWKVVLPAVRIEASLANGRLTALVTPAHRNSDELRRLTTLTVEQSLLASDIVQNTPAFEPGEQPVSELYVNLAPLWKLARAEAPARCRPSSPRPTSISCAASRGVLARRRLDPRDHDAALAGLAPICCRACWAASTSTRSSRASFPKDVAAGQLLAFDLGAPARSC